VSTVDPWAMQEYAMFKAEGGSLLKQFWNRTHCGSGREKLPLIPGDWVYFHNNKDYDQKTGPWKGEHAIYVGDNADGIPVFIGHGMEGTPTAKDIHDTLFTELQNKLGSGYGDGSVPRKTETLFKP